MTPGYVASFVQLALLARLEFAVIVLGLLLGDAGADEGPGQARDGGPGRGIREDDAQGAGRDGRADDGDDPGEDAEARQGPQAQPGQEAGDGPFLGIRPRRRVVAASPSACRMATPIWSSRKPACLSSATAWSAWRRSSKTPTTVERCLAAAMIDLLLSTDRGGEFIHKMSPQRSDGGKSAANGVPARGVLFLGKGSQPIVASDGQSKTCDRNRLRNFSP